MRKTSNSAPCLDLARVLVAHSQLAARLTLQTILQAGGYAVDVAATSAEAVALLDKGKYELVLTGGDPGLRAVLSYARIKDYRPATVPSPPTRWSAPAIPSAPTIPFAISTKFGSAWKMSRTCSVG